MYVIDTCYRLATQGLAASLTRSTTSARARVQTAHMPKMLGWPVPNSTPSSAAGRKVLCSSFLCAGQRSAQPASLLEPPRPPRCGISASFRILPATSPVRNLEDSRRLEAGGPASGPAEAALHTSLWSTWSRLLQEMGPPPSCARCQTTPVLSDYPHFRALSVPGWRFSPSDVP